MSLLTYDDVSAISYVGSDIAVLLTPEQQSMAVQAMAIFAMPHTWSDWEQNKNSIDELVSATLLALETPVTIPPNSINYEHTHWHINSQNRAGSALALTIRTTQIMNHFAAQTPAVQNDEWESVRFWIPAGQPFLFDAYGLKTAGSGILTYNLKLASDDSVLATMTQDLYSAVAVDNFKFALGYTAPTDRAVYLHGKVASKNASSSGYGCALTVIMARA